ncbi:MAG: aminotransferase class IV [Herpetosiphonaceae bacterium]|nr:aminotransferase class IV [Herpetosiphonaceae bacterium]
MPDFCILDGALLALDAARIDPSDRGWSLADGCFETLRATRGGVLWLAQHRERLDAGLAVMGITPPDLRDLPAMIRRLLAAYGAAAGVVRLQVTRGPATERGLAPPASSQPTTLLTFAPELPLPAMPSARRAIIAGSTRRNEWSPLSRIKALASYPDLLLALQEAHGRGADEALLRNTTGELACSTVANLWIVRGRTLLTPAAACGATPGVVRHNLLAAAQSLGLTASEGRIQPADLWGAAEVLLTNVVRGVQSVVAVDGRPIGSGAAGPVAQQVLGWLRDSEAQLERPT